ncbi:hypothetical protein B1759_17160 [Rubrivirga sp. SAORIC476]|nr:hypothetical protein B1759_17160 [Rubrivirga sp. SAORIC476]
MESDEAFDESQRLMGRLNVEADGVNLRASIKPGVKSGLEVRSMWGWVTALAAMFCFACYGVAQSGDPVRVLMLAAVFAPFFLVGAWSLDRMVYGRDEVVVRDGTITLRSVGPVVRRTRYRAPITETKFRVSDSPIGGTPLPGHRHVAFRREGSRLRSGLRHLLSVEDAERLVNALAAVRSANAV